MPRPKSQSVYRDEYGNIIQCKNLNCLSKDLVKAGFSKTKQGKRQKYICKKCNTKFIPEGKIGRPRVNPERPLTNKEKQKRFYEKQRNQAKSN